MERLAGLLAGERVRELEGKQGVVEEYSSRVEPHSPGLRERLWYGAGSLDSAVWAGEHGLHLLSSSVLFPGPDEEPDFAAVQAAQIRAFRAAGGTRASQGLVVIPTDSASAAQAERYRSYAAERLPRTRTPQGPRRLMFAPDLVGTSEEIAEQLWAHEGFREVDEVAFALPFSFSHEDYVQILTDIATRLGPALGWNPASA